MTSLSLAGLGNQVRREAASWWSTGRWRKQTVVWFLTLVGLLTAMLWILPHALAGVEGGEVLQVDVDEGAVQFTELATVIALIGATILSQGALIDDRRSGVMEWVLSKPMSRPALVLAKFTGQTLGVVVVAVLFPWIGVWAVLSMARGSMWPVFNWAGTMGMVAILVACQIALVLVLSAVSWSRGLVIGLPLALVAGSDLVTTMLPWIAPVNPYLVGRTAAGFMLTGELAAIGPVLAAMILTVVFVAIAAWRLDQYEF